MQIIRRKNKGTEENKSYARLRPNARAFSYIELKKKGVNL